MCIGTCDQLIPTWYDVYYCCAANLHNYQKSHLGGFLFSNMCKIYIKHGLISEQAVPILTTNICRNAAAIAFRLGERITTGTPYRPQNVCQNGVPVRSGTTTPLPVTIL